MRAEPIRSISQGRVLNQAAYQDLKELAPLRSFKPIDARSLGASKPVVRIENDDGLSFQRPITRVGTATERPRAAIRRLNIISREPSTTWSSGSSVGSPVIRRVSN